MTPRSRRIADRISSRLERSDRIDALAEPIHARINRTARPGELRDALSGTALGHPAHPALVLGPLGCWVGALAADLIGERRTASALTGTGVLLVVPTALTGLSDWADTTGAERRVGFVHLAVNTTATGWYAASWLARRRDAHRAGVALGVLGAITAAAGGWLGGHLAYALGVGVDTTAFDGGPTDWTRISRERDNPAAGSAAGIPLLVVDGPDGPAVLADRCTHRGGPLSEGLISDGCVTCPWHGSRFSLADGTVQRGPAVVPQPVYEVRPSGTGIEVRRDEQRSLRTNPVRRGDAGP